MRKLTLLLSTFFAFLFLFACSTNTFAQTNAPQTLGDWCQAPSWAFGLPNIVTYMGIVCIIAIVSTLVVVAISHRDQKALRLAREQANTMPSNEGPIPERGDKFLTDRDGNKWFIEEGNGQRFLIYRDGQTFTASHDETWSKIALRFEGIDYVYRDYNGNNSYICSQSGAPLGKLLKMRVPVSSGG